MPGELRLVDGRKVQVVYRGVWSNSDGPDFAGAMISIDGRLRTGSIEIHTKTSEWYAHGHETDPAYDSVILHVVLENDRAEDVRTINGARVPTLELQGIVTPRARHDQARERAILASLGRRTCLPTVGSSRPDRVRSVLAERGWSRLVEKQLRFCQDLQVLTAPEVLYRGILEALGYSSNREPMKLVAAAAPLQLIERKGNLAQRREALAILLGVGGFLPLSPTMQSLVDDESSDQRWERLDRQFDSMRTAYELQSIALGQWTLHRVRPANHPVARLASMAALIEQSRPDGLFASVMSLRLDDGSSWDKWLARARPAIGKSRRRQIIVNILAPFLAAYAEITRDDVLAEQVASLWERLPGGVSDRIARTTRDQILGSTRFPIRTALEEQGLHDIHRNGCAQLRCFECPIARLAVELEPWNAEPSD